ncbi:MAG TPA: glutamine--tRNA ligase/YqeY domain fusion protein, partial [Longimicrobiales bacterium]
MTTRPASAGSATPAAPEAGLDFIRAIVAEDLREGRYATIVTRFPPEPNGYLHIGHAKAITLNFGIAAETGGRCNLRFDDSNPETEDMIYVEAAIDLIRWLGYEPSAVLFASDYFEQMYQFGEHLVRTGNAYVDSLNEEEIRDYRGTVTEPGRDSPYRERSVEENLDLLRRMRAGEFPDGAHVLRGKIDMASPNMLMRDPLLYRIRHVPHYRTGDAWCIYPLYDYAHPIEDAIEGVTHSLCSLEFETHRPLYDWVVENIPHGATPHQYEFARLNLDYTVMSKRKLLQLVNEERVSGWDDPRLPTLAGMRRRGIPASAIRTFCDMVGITKSASRTELGTLEYAIRDDLNLRAPRVLCVLRPLPVLLTNVADGVVEYREAPFFPHDVRSRAGDEGDAPPPAAAALEGHEATRGLPFSNRILIERDDFMDKPPRGYHRLSPGAQVRLRHGPIVRCDDVVRDEAGEVVELRCSVQPDDGRTVKGTIHWVSEAQSLPCEVRLYDRLFTVAEPDAGIEGASDFKAFLNEESLTV